MATLLFLLLVAGSIGAVAAGQGIVAALMFGFACVIAVMDSISARMKKRKD